MPTMRVALELLLHQQCQPVEPFAHVRVAGCQPYSQIRLQRDHDRAPVVNAVIAADTVAASTAPVIRTRATRPNSISIIPTAAADAPVAGAIATAANLEVGPDRSHKSRRQRYNWLVWIPAARATSDAIAPRSSDAATIRSFSETGQRRRRSTDVITSTRPFVI
jgi:hypothetical protein